MVLQRDVTDFLTFGFSLRRMDRKNILEEVTSEIGQQEHNAIQHRSLSSRGRGGRGSEFRRQLWGLSRLITIIEGYIGGTRISLHDEIAKLAGIRSLDMTTHD